MTQNACIDVATVWIQYSTLYAVLLYMPKQPGDISWISETGESENLVRLEYFMGQYGTREGIFSAS